MDDFQGEVHHVTYVTCSWVVVRGRRKDEYETLMQKLRQSVGLRERERERTREQCAILFCHHDFFSLQILLDHFDFFEEKKKTYVGRANT